MLRKVCLLLVCFILTAITCADVSSADDLAERLEIIEARLDDQEVQHIHFVDISGYIDTEFIFTDKTGENDEFRIHHLSLMFTKKLTDKWSFFSEVEFEDAPFFQQGGTEEGKILVEAVYSDYAMRQELNLRFGRYLTPAGIWNVDHYPPFVTTQLRPQHIRQIFPQYTDGLQVFGSKNLGTSALADYHLYVGNGGGEAGSGDSNQGKAVGARLNVKFFKLMGLQLGVSGYTGRDSDNTDRTSYGADVKFTVRDLTFQGEYAQADLDPTTGSSYDRSGWYTQLSYRYDAVSFVYRYDWYRANSTTSSKTTINTIALNYHFTPKIVGKFENHFVNPQATEDYYQGIVSIALFIGK